MTADAKTLNNDISEGVPPVEGIWDNFGQPLINLNSYVTCDDRTPLALAVLDAYDIPYNLSSHSFRHGTLKDMDIKRMDAMTVLRNSLMEESFAGSDDKFVEAIVNARGEVEFREIGKSTSNISDVYYSIQTGQYVDEPKGVMVTGGKPVPEFQPLRWSPIWAGDPNGAEIYAAGSMLQNCMEPNWKSYATIIFTDPHLESTYEDGIDNLYEITAENPWDEILGYVVCIDPGADATSKTTVQYNTEAEIPLRIASSEGDSGLCPIGNLQDMPTYDPESQDENCWGSMTGGSVSYEDGVPVIIPERFRFENIRGNEVDKFVSITNVYIIGQELDAVYSRPLDDEMALEEITEANSNIWVTQNNTRRTSYKLDEKRHYAVAYQDEDGDGFQEISIVFSQEVRPHDKITYGNGDGGGVMIRMDPLCEQAKAAEFDGGAEVARTILPWNKTKGIIVEEIWVTAKVETPSITIYDPDGRNQKALRIAENLKYYIAPMVMRTPPAPIGYEGNTSGPIDQTPSKRDNDPTTTQDFDDTPMEAAMDEMQGSGMTATFGFLNGGGGATADAAYESAAKESQQAAETIYGMINDDVTETVYTCGPGADPVLGDKGPAGGIINSVRYSYSDQGSYTISVSEGPTLIGNLVQVDGGPSQKMAEDNSSRGTITQALGDNIHFKVRIDGFGERWAVNTSHHVIREHDVVQCTVHNNPVEA